MWIVWDRRIYKHQSGIGNRVAFIRVMLSMIFAFVLSVVALYDLRNKTRRFCWLFRML